MNLTKLSNKELLQLLNHYKHNRGMLLDILEEFEIRDKMNTLDYTYIDEILDNYNFNKFLYELTGDIAYTDKMFGYEAEFYKHVSIG